ncbi:MAG: gluconokinase, partial [Chitinophagaceae bacterium]
MKAVYVIGIDIGTGSTKAVALDVNGEVVATAQQHYPSLPAAPGTDEQDPEVIWEAFVHCINSVIDKAGHAPAIISLSSCMHSLLAVNVDGKPITNMITWADARSQAVAEHLRQSGEAEALYNATGTPLHSMSPLSKIIWFGQKERETFAKAARWISVKEYIWWRLFSAYEVDVSIATASGMMDIHQFCWHEQALKSAGIERQQLSAIVPATYMRSDLQPAAHKLLPLKEETLFCIGSSDGCMANLGSGAVQKGVGALTIGTSAAVRVVTAAPVIHYQSMLFNYPIDEKTFVCGGPVNNGGNMIHWVIKKLKGLEQPNQKDYET